MTDVSPRSPRAEDSTRKGLALFAAAATAPPLLLFLYALLGTASSHSWGFAKGAAPQVSALILVFPVIFSMGVGFGLLGSGALLALAFGLVDRLSGRFGGLRLRWFVVAGVAAGAVHAALAGLSLHGLWPRGLGFVLGTWFAAGVIDKHPVQVWLAALLSGASAGAVYVMVRFPRRPPGREGARAAS